MLLLLLLPPPPMMMMMIYCITGGHCFLSSFVSWGGLRDCM
jgi:hypothetical protein